MDVNAGFLKEKKNHAANNPKWQIQYCSQIIREQTELGKQESKCTNKHRS